MASLGNKKLVLLATETTPGVDEIDALMAAGTPLKKMLLDTFTIENGYDIEPQGGISPNGATGESTISPRGATVQGGGGVSCWDPTTQLPAWLPVALASGFEVTENTPAVRTVLTYTGKTSPMTAYAYEKFLDGNEQLRYARGICGKMDFSWEPGKALKWSFSNGLGLFDGEPLTPGNYLDNANDPILRKDGATAPDGGFAVLCPEAAINVCGIDHEIGSLSYPVNTGSIETPQTVSEVIAATSCPIVAEVCCERDGDVTGTFDLLSVGGDGLAALLDYRSKFPIGAVDTYDIVFTTPDCVMTFAFPAVQMLPYTRNVGEKISWGVPWKTVDQCDSAAPDFTITIEPVA